MRTVGGQERREMQEPAAPGGAGQVRGQGVEPVVVDDKAHDAEETDAQLEACEKTELYSVAMIVAAFMAGLGLGSHLGGRLSARVLAVTAPHAAVQSQDSLPGHLVDEGGGTAREEKGLP